MKDSLIIFVKAPVPGRVKTRLVPPLTYDQAAAMYRDWAASIYTSLLKIPALSVEIAYEPHPDFPSPDWIKTSSQEVPFFLQEGENLGERLKNAFHSVFKKGHSKGVIIGSDSPGLPTEYIRDAFSSLDNNDLVLGPTPDGGYYLIGLKDKIIPDLFRDIPWSSSTVLEKTLAQAKKHSLKTDLLPEYLDIDRPKDLESLEPTFSIIIPTKNEAGTILKTLTHIRQTSSSYSTETIIVDGGSQDDTLALVQNKATLVLKYPQPNRGAQMHCGAQQAKGKIFLFLHADTLLPDNWQNILMEVFSESGGKAPVALAFRLSFDSDKLFYRTIELLTRVRTFFTRVPHGDQALAVQREAYKRSGGYPNAPLMEEYLLIPKLRKMGRLFLLQEKVRTSSRKYVKKGPLRNSLRNLTLIFLFFLGVSPNKLSKIY